MISLWTAGQAIVLVQPASQSRRAGCQQANRLLEAGYIIIDSIALVPQRQAGAGTRCENVELLSRARNSHRGLEMSRVNLLRLEKPIPFANRLQYTFRHVNYPRLKTTGTGHSSSGAPRRRAMLPVCHAPASVPDGPPKRASLIAPKRVGMQHPRASANSPIASPGA